MSGERETSPQFDGFGPLPAETELMDRRLRHDGATWQSRVPETQRLDALARTLAGTLDVPEPEELPHPNSPSATPPATMPEVSAARLIPLRRRSRMQNLLAIVAMVAIVSLMGALLIGIGLAHRGPAAPAQVTLPTATATAKPTATPTSTPTSTPTLASFTVTRVDLSVTPTSIAGTTCGTFLTVTYTATFHLAPNGPGGTIHFNYTVNNGRGTTVASVTVAQGQTTATYSFAWSGNLPADHTEPESGGVIVQSPNAVSSPLLGPSGRCS